MFKINKINNSDISKSVPTWEGVERTDSPDGPDCPDCTDCTECAHGADGAIRDELHKLVGIHSIEALWAGVFGRRKPREELRGLDRRAVHQSVLHLDCWGLLPGLPSQQFQVHLVWTRFLTRCWLRVQLIDISPRLYLRLIRSRRSCRRGTVNFLRLLLPLLLRLSLWIVNPGQLRNRPQQRMRLKLPLLQYFECRLLLKPSPWAWLDMMPTGGHGVVELLKRQRKRLMEGPQLDPSFKIGLGLELLS